MLAGLAGCAGDAPSPHPSAADNAACPLQGPALRTKAFDHSAPGRGAGIAAGNVVAHVCAFNTGRRRANDRALVVRGPLLRRLLADLRSASRLSGPVSSCIRTGPTGRLRLVDRSGAATDLQFAGVCGRLMVVVNGRRVVVLRGSSMQLLDSAVLYVAARRGEPAAPDLTGLSLREAIRRTGAAGYRFSGVDQVVDQALPAGRVASQSVPPGNLLTPEITAGSPERPDVGVTLVVADAPPCSAANLAARYRAGQVGAGSNFGSIRVRDVGHLPCRLPVTLRIVGLDRRGTPVTPTVPVAVDGPAVLVPRTPRTPRIGRVAYGAFAAEIGLAANARDDFRTGGACDEHQLTPHAWRITLGRGGGTLAVRNHDSTRRQTGGSPGLLTCRGEILEGGVGVQLAGTAG